MQSLFCTFYSKLSGKEQALITYNVNSKKPPKCYSELLFFIEIFRPTAAEKFADQGITTLEG